MRESTQESREMGKKIMDRRKELRMTQTALAELTGYNSKAAIHSIESGLNSVPVDRLPRFAEALKLDIDHLVGLTDKSDDTDKDDDVSRFADTLPHLQKDTSRILFDSLKSCTDADIQKTLEIIALLKKE